MEPRLKSRIVNVDLLHSHSGVFAKIDHARQSLWKAHQGVTSVARVVVLGAGFAGHTAALYLGQRLGKEHEVTVVNRHDFFGFVPSWVWVGIGHMAPEKTTFKLKPVYDRMHVNLVVGKATEVHPDAGEQYVLVSTADGAHAARRL